MSHGVYVTKVGRGQKYWFIEVSIPRSWMALELTYEEFARRPGELHRIVARQLTAALRGAGRAEQLPGENPFDSVRGPGE